jgi:hypothetical protein
MTKLEFDTFVSEQLQGRWPKWQPTTAMLHDWYDILRCHSLDVATSVVQEHRLSEMAVVFEPKINEVVKLLARRRHKPNTGQIGPAWVPWVRCLEAPTDNPNWQGREWLRLEYRSPSCANSRRHVADAAGRSAREIRHVHGGQWCGVVRPDGQSPPEQPELTGKAAREWVEQDTLNGPDGPGRRSVLGRHAQYVPAVAEAMAMRVDAKPALIEAWAAPASLPPTESEQQSDEEFFAANPVEADNQGWERG